MNTPIRVDITGWHISHAKQQVAIKHPIALAIKGRFANVAIADANSNDASILFDEAHSDPHQFIKIYYSPELRQWAGNFNWIELTNDRPPKPHRNRKPVKPITIEITPTKYQDKYQAEIV